MRKLLWIFVGVLAILSTVGCDNRDATALRAERAEIRKQIGQLSNTLEQKQLLADSLDAELTAKGIRMTGREPNYVLELILHTDYISDEVHRGLMKIDNALITVHVDKATYQRAHIGSEIFRIPGDIFYDASGLYFKVNNKYIN